MLLELRQISWLPRDADTLEVLKVIFGAADFLTIKRPKHSKYLGNNFISSDGFKELLLLKNNEIDHLEHLKLNEKQCFIAYGSKSASKNGVKIYCLELDEKNALRLSLHAEIKKNVKQVLSLPQNRVALLMEDNALEIWFASAEFQQLQKLNLNTTSTQMAVGYTNDLVTYVAIITQGKSETLVQTSVEIFSSIDKENFEHRQTIENLEAEEIQFHFVAESQDLLLLVRTKMPSKPLVIYQLTGVMGFTEIFSSSALSESSKMQPLYLKSENKHFIALFNANKDVTFIEIVLKTF